MSKNNVSIGEKLIGMVSLLQGKMPSDEYKYYILGLIFFKYLSENRNPLLWPLLPPSLSFESLADKAHQGEPVREALIEALKTIEGQPGCKLYGVFGKVDLCSPSLGNSDGEKESLVAGLLNYLRGIKSDTDGTSPDVLGDAYEYLIGRFASVPGKSVGEFYTPPQVAKILVSIVTSGKQELRSVFDPTCGSGSLLLRAAKQVKKVGFFYGQESNPLTYSLAKMNMLMHGTCFDTFDILHGDTLANPGHKGMSFEAIVANPPFSAQWQGPASSSSRTDERFLKYGALAPRTKADFAFISHMVHHLAEDGTMATVMPMGVLFRSSAEGKIRKELIDGLNYLDAVIGLPSNIFYGTSIPTCILVFKKCRKADDRVIFIDSSGPGCFVKNGNQNELRDIDVDRAISAYKGRESIKKYAYAASLVELAENDWNLNIPRYVNILDEPEKINLHEVAGKMARAEDEMNSLDIKIRKSCNELGIPPPFKA